MPSDFFFLQKFERGCFIEIYCIRKSQSTKSYVDHFWTMLEAKKNPYSTVRVGCSLNVPFQIMIYNNTTFQPRKYLFFVPSWPLACSPACSHDHCLLYSPFLVPCQPLLPVLYYPLPAPPACSTPHCLLYSPLSALLPLAFSTPLPCLLYSPSPACSSPPCSFLSPPLQVQDTAHPYSQVPFFHIEINKTRIKKHI